jgi:hypothetical protein
VKKFLVRYWGFLALALAITWLVEGWAKVIIALVLAVAALGYFLLQAPMWCGADNRDGQHCRNNSTGLLLGCRLRQHKWQKLKMIFVSRQWRETGRWVMSSARGCVAALGALGALGSVVSAVVAVMTLK